MKIYFPLLILLFIIFYGFGQNQYETIIRWGKRSPNIIDSLISNNRKISSLPERIADISGFFLKTPYQANTLIGDMNTPEKLVIDFEAFDCFTFLDEIVALSISTSWENFKLQLTKIRYENGQVSFFARNHFFIQWLKNNSHLFISEKLFSEKTKCVKKMLNQKQNKSLWLKGIPLTEREVCFVGHDEIDQQFFTQLKSGDFIGFCTDQKGLDVSHVGLVILKDRIPFLRHASLRHKEVMDENLQTYWRAKPDCIGLIVSRPILQLAPEY